MLKGTAHRLLTDGSITVDLSSEGKRYSARISCSPQPRLAQRLKGCEPP